MSLMCYNFNDTATQQNKLILQNPNELLNWIAEMFFLYSISNFQLCRKNQTELLNKKLWLFDIFSTYDRIRLIIKPWKKPEGLLNKPVFKMMIESVMLYVMMFSGVHFNAICEKYTPYLQPFCIRELMDVSSFIQNAYN